LVVRSWELELGVGTGIENCGGLEAKDIWNAFEKIF
jgi:hypothetical protein